jgi:septin family protein
LTKDNREVSDKHVVDSRIHLCLYFIDSESRLNVKDILHLKKLRKLVNVIPVMVGNDPEVDSEEIEAYKDRLNKDARDYEIEWLNLQHEVPNIQRIIQENHLQPIAPCPPFWYQHAFDEDT